MIPRALGGRPAANESWARLPRPAVPQGPSGAIASVRRFFIFSVPINPDLLIGLGSSRFPRQFLVQCFAPVGSQTGGLWVQRGARWLGGLTVDARTSSASAAAVLVQTGCREGLGGAALRKGGIAPGCASRCGKSAGTGSSVPQQGEHGDAFESCPSLPGCVPPAPNPNTSPRCIPFRTRCCLHGHGALESQSHSFSQAVPRGTGRLLFLRLEIISECFRGTADGLQEARLSRGHWR